MLFQLPVEIFLLMISMLQPGDLKQFRLVSRLCSSISFPAFMMHLVVDDTPGRLRALQAFFRTHSHIWTREMTIIYTSGCDRGLNAAQQSDRLIFLRQLPRLRKLTLHGQNSLTAQPTLDLVRSIITLEELSIQASMIITRMRDAVCPSVSILRIANSRAPSAKLLTRFIGCFPALALCHLSLSFQDSCGEVILGAMEWPRLIYLALDGFQINKGHCFCDFLRRHPNLRQVMMQRIEFS